MGWHIAWVKLGLVAIIAALTAACSRDPSAGPGDGPAVFRSLCTSCHGEDGRPPAAMIARLGVRDLTAAEFRARVTPDLVEHQVRAGSKNKLMPSFEGVLDDAKIKAVAGYVASPRFVAPP